MAGGTFVLRCFLLLQGLLTIPVLAQVAVPDSGRNVVVVTTNPSGATIYLDSLLVGQSPILFTLTNEKANFVLAEKDGFIPESWPLPFRLRDSTKIEIRLKQNSSWIRISFDTTRDAAFLGSTRILLNTGYVRVPCGSYSIRIASRDSHRWINRGIQLEPEDTVEISGKTGTPSVLPVAFSLLLPGLGQLYDRSTLKGLGFLAAEAGAILYLLHAQSENDEAVKRYESALGSYRLQNTEAWAAATWPVVEDRRNEANSAATKVKWAKGLAVAIYAVNLIDAVLFHSVDDNMDIVESNRGIKLRTRIAPGIRDVRAGISLEF
jgi:hypothetical protein